jgi:hypothetical protein
VRLGVVVDGESETAGLLEIYPQLAGASGHVFLNPVVAPIPPLAPYPTMARACEPYVDQLSVRRADRVIVLVDRESRPDCCGIVARAFQAELAARVAVPVAVVVKNSMFENWVIADISAVRAVAGRFTVSRAIERAVQSNKADNVAALDLLKRCVTRGGYEKVQDARRILANADVLEIGAHSRSFRRFLRESGHPSYAAQSLRP